MSRLRTAFFFFQIAYISKLPKPIMTKPVILLLASITEEIGAEVDYCPAAVRIRISPPGHQTEKG